MATVDVDATTESGGKAAAAVPSPPAGNFSGGVNLVLRALLFAATLSALVVLVTAKQSVMVPVVLLPRPILAPMDAKFNHSPALIYLLAALCVTCLYSLLTAVSSLRLVAGSASTAKTLFLLVLDVFYAAIMASATGSAGGVAWVGLKGNSHTRWSEICNIYGKFCRHIGGSTFLSLIASIVLVLLAVVNAYSLYRRSR